MEKWPMRSNTVHIFQDHEPGSKICIMIQMREYININFHPREGFSPTRRSYFDRIIYPKLTECLLLEGES